jgi:hypothetical protein
MVSKTNNEIDGACGRYGGRGERCTQSSGMKTWGKRPLENLGIDGRMILKEEGRGFTGLIWFEIGKSG